MPYGSRMPPTEDRSGAAVLGPIVVTVLSPVIPRVGKSISSKVEKLLESVVGCCCQEKTVLEPLPKFANRLH
jgi:hypothetical protein